MRPAIRPLRATLALAAGLAAACAPAAAQSALDAVRWVDLARYAGTWHEVARLPNRFQRDCASDVTATYRPRGDGRVDVVNRCRTAGGGEQVARGLARPVEAGNAKLEVSFLPALLRPLPFGWGDYWVLALDGDYQWSLVGEPSRRHLWVLSRTPDMDPALLEQLLARAATMGYDTTDAIRSRTATASATR